MSRSPDPVAGLDGLEARWSRRVTAPDGQGVARTWHVLDNGAEPSAGTMLCVHGNPTWSYLWRRFLAAALPGWRVVAVDHLGMGWSERLPAIRRLAERIDDLDAVTTALGVEGPVVPVAHDWGGPIALGWALRHRDRLAGLVLTNTAVHHDPAAAAPALIRLARSRPLRDLVCVRTPAFVRTAAALSRPALPVAVRAGLAQPYPDPRSRGAVGDFVADIPLEPDHPSRAPLAAVAAGLAELKDVPALLLWGARDPVFTERYLADLTDRLPHADVQRYAQAGHLVTEDVPETAELTWRWLADRRAKPPQALRQAQSASPPWAAQQDRAGDGAAAIVAMRRGVAHRLSFAGLEDRIAVAAARLQDAGVRPGHRVALLVPPGLDLTVAVYACWRAGAVIVVADAGLGLRGLFAALRGAGPDHVIGTRPHAGRRPTRPADQPPDPGWRAAPRGAHGRTGAARPGRRRGRAVHLRSDRPGQGRGLHRGPAGRTDRAGAVDLPADPGGHAGRGLRPVRALWTGPRGRRGGAGHGRHRSRHADRGRAGRRRRCNRRDRGLCRTGGPAQRGGDGRFAVRRPAGRAEPGPTGDVGRCAGPGRVAPRGRRGAARRRAAHAVRDDRGTAGQRHLAARDRGRRAGQRSVRRSAAARGGGPAESAGPARSGRRRADRRAGGDRGDLCRGRPREGALRPAVGAAAGQRAQPGLAPHRRRRPPRPGGPAMGRGSAGARGHQPGRAGHAGRRRAGRRGAGGDRARRVGRGGSGRYPGGGGRRRPASPVARAAGRRGAGRRRSARPRRFRWRRSSPSAGCPPTSATTPRSTAPPSPDGRTGCWPASDRAGCEGPGHRGQRSPGRGHRPEPWPPGGTRSPCCSAARPGSGCPRCWPTWPTPRRSAGPPPARRP